MTPDGWQQERYPDQDFEQMPLKPATDKLGNPLSVCVELAGQNLCARVWVVKVGKVSLYLLDTDLPDNSPEFRQVTARLYGGGLEMRLRQEILLGIGGIKALVALGVEPMARAATELGICYNTGEGGLHKSLYKYGKNTIVQVASGRFGVHRDFLNAGAAIEIKIGQGAKPGIGGHLPGEKINAMIFRGGAQVG